MDRISSCFKSNSRHNLYYSADLLSILAQLANNNILAVPFKGPVLSQSVYGDFFLRSFVDLDFLVHKHDAPKVFELLLSMGYVPEANLNQQQFLFYLKNEYSIALFRPSGQGIVELHWDLTGRYTSCSFGLKDFADRIELSSLMGRKIFKFPSEELLVYLCVHGSKDGWAKLESVSCIAALIESREHMDWRRVFYLGRKYRCKRMLLLGLQLTSDLFEVNLPEPILQEIDLDSGLKKISHRICDSLLNKNIDANEVTSTDFSSFHFQIRDSPAEKILFFLRLIFQPSRSEWKCLHLPVQFAFLHYLLRPLRLFSGFLSVSPKMAKHR